MPVNQYIEFSNPVSVQFTRKLPAVKPFMMKSLFTDNSKVCYKPGSLAPGGVGTVRNSAIKSRKT